MEPGGAAEFHETRRPIRLKRSRDRLSFLFCFSVEKKIARQLRNGFPYLFFFPFVHADPGEALKKSLPNRQRSRFRRINVETHFEFKVDSRLDLIGFVYVAVWLLPEAKDAATLLCHHLIQKMELNPGKAYYFSKKCRFAITLLTKKHQSTSIQVQLNPS